MPIRRLAIPILPSCAVAFALLVPSCAVPNAQREVTTTHQPKAIPTPATAAVSPTASPATSTSVAPATQSDNPHDPAALVDPLGATRIDPDGNDQLGSDGAGAGAGTPPTAGHFEKVGRAPISLRQICDLTPFGDTLYAAHSLAALNADGATISRYRPSDPKRPFAVAFDWNRPGEPSKGGGAGQGFLRIHAIDGRLYVPDADPPYNGFGLMDWGTEGYVFVSDRNGAFAPATRPHFRPPGRPQIDGNGRGGAMVIPRAYHVFDVIQFRGQLIASTGAVPPNERAWVGASPGALHVATADRTHFEYKISYPLPYPGGVWRLTFLVRFRDRLYAGIEDYDGRSPHDYVVVAPPANTKQITQEHLTPVRVTEGGGTQTLRWYVDRHRLYWIGWGHDGIRLRRTDDGDHWTAVELPSDAGAPTDLTRFRGALFLLTERALYRIEERDVTLVTHISDKKSPFELRDSLCAAPLSVFNDELYAGGQRDGSLYRFVADSG